MLISLYIENYALIDKLTINFGRGFNVITGETGAGKSIIVGALAMILGERASADLIKSGASRAILEAVFDIKQRQIKDLENEELLIITRELSASGNRNICKINGRIVTQAQLKETSKYLLDIHGQHQHQLLIDPTNHLGILDLFVEKNLTAKAATAYADFAAVKKEYEALLANKDLKQEEKDYLKFQLEELSAAKPQKGEYTELKAEKSKLDNFTEIAENIRTINHLNQEIYALLQKNQGGLGRIASKQQELGEFAEQLDTVALTFEELKNSLKSYESGLEYDPRRLEEINERIDTYETLKRKHLKKITEDLDLGELLQVKKNELTQLLNNIEFSEDKLLELEKKHKQLEKYYLDAAQALSTQRREIAALLEKKIVNSLQELKMSAAQFGIHFSKRTEYSADGIDEIEFLISPNLGEPLKPLAKIASGGEISRIMLAIKEILIDKDLISSMIFDEIDTGIGGDTANAIAAKIAAIAKKHQVICITHLAQIASAADQHLLVQKETQENKTIVTVRDLQRAEKELEIARMLSGRITEKTKAHAKELLGTR